MRQLALTSLLLLGLLLLAGCPKPAESGGESATPAKPGESRLPAEMKQKMQGSGATIK